MIKTQNSLAGPSRRIPTIPREWEGTISSPIEDNEVTVFLSSFQTTIEHLYIPTKRHFQLLLYLSLTSATSQRPLMLLAQILTLYPPSALSPLIPCILRPGVKPQWSNWDSDADELRGTLDRSVRTYMKRAINGGIWGLIWDIESEKGSKNDEDNENRQGSVVISENGWDVLSRFVGSWKRDQEENRRTNPGQDWSPQFLAQLLYPYDPSSSLQHDNASLPLCVVRSYLSLLVSRQGKGYGADEPKKATARNILGLLISATGSSAPFHPASLLLSLITLLRVLPPHVLTKSIDILLPAEITEHIAVILLEDLAGVRKSKMEERNKGEFKGDFEQDRNGLINGGKERNPFPPPTPDYLGKILLLQPQQPNAESWNKVERLKTYLLRRLMGRLTSKGQEGKMGGLKWLEDKEWREKFRNSLSSGSGQGGDEADIGRSLELLDILSEVRRTGV